MEACEAILEAASSAFVMLGGNFVRAIPDRGPDGTGVAAHAADRERRDQTQSQPTVHGAISFILPVLGRIEIDRAVQRPAGGLDGRHAPRIHGSRGARPPASPHLISEVALIAGRQGHARSQSEAAMGWLGRGLQPIRAAISETYPEVFHDYESRMWQPGGFHRPCLRASGCGKPPTGRANFITPHGLDEDHRHAGNRSRRAAHDDTAQQRPVQHHRLRLRGPVPGHPWHAHGRADEPLRHRPAGSRRGRERRVADGSERQHQRTMSGFRVTPYDIPVGCVATYYPEANALLPLWHYAEGSKTPAAKSIPVVLNRLAAPV